MMTAEEALKLSTNNLEAQVNRVLDKVKEEAVQGHTCTQVDYDDCPSHIQDYLKTLGYKIKAMNEHYGIDYDSRIFISWNT